MKKIISAILVCGVLTSASVSAVCANEETPLLTSSVSAGYSVVTGDKTLELSDAYADGKNIMIPLRKVAESLGFKVVWDEDKQGVTLDDGEVNTTVYIGTDSYYMASSTAIEMSAPTELGSAPVLKDSTTYVPVDMFKILYCNDSAVTADGKKITINSRDDKKEENTQIPNPIVEYKTVEDAEKAVSFKPVMPAKIPDGYKLAFISVISGKTFQLVYENGDNEITYRVAEGTDDISGDYNVYKNITETKVGGMGR